ncbi:TPA: hypothetical protein L5996_30970 [Pseudomonas aeruginosa]|nr:hypothetical protein [Pseudomonas aeruginosa]HBP6170894.1 hypothetical protein [Pseudomonas aeruginosa]
MPFLFANTDIANAIQLCLTSLISFSQNAMDANIKGAMAFEECLSCFVSQSLQSNAQSLEPVTNQRFRITVENLELLSVLITPDNQLSPFGFPHPFQEVAFRPVSQITVGAELFQVLLGANIHGHF